MQNSVRVSAENAVGLAQNDVITFNSAEFGNVRTVIIDGQPWFVGKDVATSLGYGKGKSLNNAVADHVDEEDKGVTKMETPGGKQNVIIINESGLYSLILGSKLESAKKFKRWVTSEVLPTIRKSGSYTFTQTKIVDPVREKEIGLARAEFLRSMAREYAGKSETYPKRHDHVIRDIRDMYSKLGKPNFGETYLDRQGKKRPFRKNLFFFYFFKKITYTAFQIVIFLFVNILFFAGNEVLDSGF